MRIKQQDRTGLLATHKGCEIQIDKEHGQAPGRFYIIVKAPDGGCLYDGWSPPQVTTMAQAKREALYGSGLKAPPHDR